MDSAWRLRRTSYLSMVGLMTLLALACSLFSTAGENPAPPSTKGHLPVVEKSVVSVRDESTTTPLEPHPSIELQLDDSADADEVEATHASWLNALRTRVILELLTFVSPSHNKKK